MTQVIICCPRGGYKFIVIKNEKGGMVVYADDDPQFDYHRVLLAEYQNDSGMRARCLGGGQIRFNGEKKTIMISGSSGDFGVEPDRMETVKAIKAAYPDFEVSSR